MSTHQSRARRSRRFRRQASRRHPEHRRRASRVAGRSRAGQDPRGGQEISASRHVTTELDESLARDDVDAVILCTPTQMHASQAHRLHEAGKHVQVEIPLADKWEDARAVAQLQKQTGLVCMVRPHAALQSVAPMGASPAARWRIEDPADGRADLFLPPHQHQRAGPAAVVDRPFAVAPCRAHGGSVPLSDGRGQSPSRMPCRGRSIPKLGIAMDMSHSAEDAHRVRSARCR